MAKINSAAFIVSLVMVGMVAIAALSGAFTATAPGERAEAACHVAVEGIYSAARKSGEFEDLHHYFMLGEHVDTLVRLVNKRLPSGEVSGLVAFVTVSHERDHGAVFVAKGGKLCRLVYEASADEIEQILDAVYLGDEKPPDKKPPSLKPQGVYAPSDPEAVA